VSTLFFISFFSALLDFSFSLKELFLEQVIFAQGQKLTYKNLNLMSNTFLIFF
jgi:hypothetical protein